MTNLNHKQIINQLKNVSAGINTPDQFTKALANKGYDVSQQEHGKIRIRKKGFIQTFKETRAAANAQRTTNMSKLQAALVRNYTFNSATPVNTVVKTHLNRLRSVNTTKALFTKENIPARGLNAYLGQYYNLGGTANNNKRSIARKKGVLETFKAARAAVAQQATNKRELNTIRLTQLLGKFYNFKNGNAPLSTVRTTHLNRLRANRRFKTLFNNSNLPATRSEALNTYLGKFYNVGSEENGRKPIRTKTAAKENADAQRQGRMSKLSTALSRNYTFGNNKTLKNAIIAAHLNKIQDVNLNASGSLNNYLYKYYNIGTRQPGQQARITKKPVLRNRRGTNQNEMTRARARVNALLEKEGAKTNANYQTVRLKQKLEAFLKNRYNAPELFLKGIVTKHFNKIRANQAIKLNSNAVNIGKLDEYLTKHYNVNLGARASGSIKVRIMNKPRFRIPGGTGQARINAQNIAALNKKLSEIYTLSPKSREFIKSRMNSAQLRQILATPNGNKTMIHGIIRQIPDFGNNYEIVNANGSSYIRSRNAINIYNQYTFAPELKPSNIMEKYPGVLNVNTSANMDKFLRRYYSIGKRNKNNPKPYIAELGKAGKFASRFGISTSKASTATARQARSPLLAARYSFVNGNLTWDKIVKNHPEILNQTNKNANAFLRKFNKQYNVPIRVGGPDSNSVILVTSKKYGKGLVTQSNKERLNKVLTTHFNFGGNKTLKNRIIAAHLKKIQHNDTTRKIFNGEETPADAGIKLRNYLKKHYNVGAAATNGRSLIVPKGMRGVQFTKKGRNNAAIFRERRTTNIQKLRKMLNNRYNFGKNEKLKNTIIKKHLSNIQVNNTQPLSNVTKLNAYLVKHYNVGTRPTGNGSKTYIMQKPLRFRRLQAIKNANEPQKAQTRVAAFLEGITPTEKSARRSAAAAKAAAAKAAAAKAAAPAPVASPAASLAAEEGN